MDKTINIYNLGNLPTAPISSFFELQEDFKISDSDKLSKLQMLILTRGFKYSFKAWKDETGKLWIIDAHQRRKALIALQNAGFIIPEIPYEPIFAESKKEAVEEIAAYNSEFAKKNPDTLLFQKYKIDSSSIERFNLGYEVKAVEFAPSEKLFNNIDLPNEDISSLDSIDSDLQENTNIFSKKGDLWLLGDNKLMCGDCCSSSDIETLMNGELADLCVTDPPYNVAYKGGTEDALTIDNDSMDKDNFYTFLLQFHSNLFNIMKPGASLYVFHADSEGENFRKAFRESGFKLSQCCVWVKNQFVMGRQDYQWQHEPVLYGWKPGAAHNWYSDRKQNTVWNFDKPQRNGIHPTMKPVALIVYPIRNSSKPKDLVVDLFSGSSSTLIACQRIDRKCYALEIDPKYVSASILRFRETFRHQPVILIRNGKKYSVDETSKIITNE